MTLTLTRQPARRGFTLTEAVVMVALVGILTSMAMVNLSGMAFGTRFRSEAERFIGLLEMAYDGAMQSEKRFELKLDVSQQSYLLRVLTPENYGQPPAMDETVETGNFSERFKLLYVEFDDGVYTDEEFNIANFRVGRAGWQQGGKILVADGGGQIWSITVNRLTGYVELRKGDVELPRPVSDASF